MLLSICIPTCNRYDSLGQILESILLSKKKNKIKSKDFEVCISDNCSKKDPIKLILFYKKYFNISYNRNLKNYGYGFNILKVVSMARNEFVWTLGDDDLLLTHSLKKIFLILRKNKKIDYFFINSYNTKKKIEVKDINDKSSIFFKKNFSRVSSLDKNFKCKFFDLINPKISFDFLSGMFHSVFRRRMWISSLNVINKKLTYDKNTFSNFDNTFTHVKILGNAFKKSLAFYFNDPLTINNSFFRNWSTMYKFIEIVRIPEILDYYRENGLSLINYINCKNYSLRNFLNYFFYILINRKKSGFKYFNFYKHFVRNMIFPNFYLSIVYFIFRKSKSCFKSLNWSL